MPGTGVVAVTLPGLSKSDVVLAQASDLTDGKPKSGAPLLLIRSLDGGDAVFESAKDGEVDPKMGAQSYDRVSIVLRDVQANYKVLLFPMRSGDSFPSTIWTADRTQITVKCGQQNKTITFKKDAKGRTLVGLSPTHK